MHNNACIFCLHHQNHEQQKYQREISKPAEGNLSRYEFISPYIFYAFSITNSPAIIFRWIFESSNRKFKYFIFVAVLFSVLYLCRALKDQGYESDSTLVFRKKENSTMAPLSPVEQKQAYLNLQAGGEAPLQGFRKPAPEKPKGTF